MKNIFLISATLSLFSATSNANNIAGKIMNKLNPHLKTLISEGSSLASKKSILSVVCINPQNTKIGHVINFFEDKKVHIGFFNEGDYKKIKDTVEAEAVESLNSKDYVAVGKILVHDKGNQSFLWMLEKSQAEKGVMGGALIYSEAEKDKNGVVSSYVQKAATSYICVTESSIPKIEDEPTY
jgi:hypothetical protein